MHVELLEIKKKKEEGKPNRKPFVYKETDFPSILGHERKRPPPGNAFFLIPLISADYLFYY